MMRRETRLADVPRAERAQVAAAAEALSKCGAYNGSETDAVTDAHAIVRAIRDVAPRRWRR